jgi:hypothetical protein
MSDQAIIEAAARAMCDRQAAEWNIISDASREWYLELAAAVTPLIRAAMLEEAAKVIEDFLCTVSEEWTGEQLLAALRALKDQP